MALSASPTADLTAASKSLSICCKHPPFIGIIGKDGAGRWSWKSQRLLRTDCCTTLLSGHESPIAHITVTVATRTKPTIDQASKNSNMDWGGAR